MSSVLKPENADQVRDAIAWAVSEDTPLEIMGRGTKRGFGRSFQVEHTLDLSGLSGVVEYEPEELIMTVLPGTPMAEVDAALEERNQMLAFEPMDMGPLYGEAGGTVGGMVACNLSGPRRIKAGAARDHLLGFSAVSGRGELFKAGAKVVKNVTGYDLSKLMTGSFGTLAALTEVTLKVLPKNEKQRTVLIFGQELEAAVVSMREAMNSPHEVSSVAYIPEAVAGRSAVCRISDIGTSVTAIRLEGPGPSAEHRCQALREALDAAGPQDELHGHNSATFWKEVRDASFIGEGGGRQVWKISVPPAAGASVVGQLMNRGQADWFTDWGGGLIWIAAQPGLLDHGFVRSCFEDCGGHATLVCGSETDRRTIPVFQPPQAEIAALSGRVKESFDPKRILNPGRMYPGV